MVGEDTPARVCLALVIVDRNEGAREALARAGIELISLFDKGEVLGND